MGTLLSTTLLSKFSVSLSSCRTLAILALLASTLACSPRSDAISASEDTLVVAAAADLARLEAPLARAFEQATGRRMRTVLGSSGMLARQIEQGAPYDVYLSADQEYVRKLVESGKLDAGTVSVYAVGRLGLWAKAATVRDLKQLTASGIRHLGIANPAHAPYGLAAREALQNAGLWERLQPKLVYGETVRQALQYAESGNADVALTAWSLVFDKGGVLVTDSLHAPIRQTGAMVADSKRQALARQFLDMLNGPAGQSILTSYGFWPPGTGAS